MAKQLQKNVEDEEFFDSHELPNSTIGRFVVTSFMFVFCFYLFMFIRSEKNCLLKKNVEDKEFFFLTKYDNWYVYLLYSYLCLFHFYFIFFMFLCVSSFLFFWLFISCFCYSLTSVCFVPFISLSLFYLFIYSLLCFRLF
jgi:hypothetical protein